VEQGALRSPPSQHCLPPRPFFRARKQPLSLYEPALGWTQFAKEGVRVNIVAGTHETILEEPIVQVLAQELKICLLEAQVTDSERLDTQSNLFVSDRRSEDFQSASIAGLQPAGSRKWRV
jgi:hypothetical protein